MKTIVLSCTLLATCGLAQAQDIGQVLSRSAVYQQVAMPRQSCTQTTNAPTSGAGALSGAVTGAVIGTILGDGRGAGALLGAMGGAIVGDRAESNANSQPVTTCTTQTVMENRWATTWSTNTQARPTTYSSPRIQAPRLRCRSHLQACLPQPSPLRPHRRWRSAHPLWSIPSPPWCTPRHQ